MPPMQLAPSKPGHVILCAVWNTPEPSVGIVTHADQTWLAGCTCGFWSCRGDSEEINKMWLEHLEDAV